jgi:hypothetical protein
VTPNDQVIWLDDPGNAVPTSHAMGEGDSFRTG